MNAKKFPWANTFILGFGFLGISVIWPIFNQYVPIFLQSGNLEFNRQLLAEGRSIPDIQGFGLAPGIALFIMTWDNLLNMFIAPWAGAASDRTWNRFGRRKPWILVGAPIALLGFIFVPAAQTVLAISVFILITDIGMALFRAPTVSWLGDFYEINDRSKANGVINMMGGIGSLLAFFVGGYLFNQFGKYAPFVAGAVAVIAALTTALILLKEPEKVAVPETDKSGVLANLKILINAPDKSGILVLLGILCWFMGFNALETGLSSFAVFSLGISAGTASIFAGLVSVSFIIFSIPAGFSGTKFGRARTIKIGLLGLGLLMLAGFFLIQSLTTFAITLILAGGFWALVNVNSLPLVYDNGDEKRIGAYTGLYYFSSQLAAVLGPTLGGLVVQFMGFQYRWLWLFSAGFMLIAWLVMSGVKNKLATERPE